MGGGGRRGVERYGGGVCFWKHVVFVFVVYSSCHCVYELSRYMGQSERVLDSECCVITANS